MMNPVVSFVIPVLNAEKDIARCLRSIQDLQCPSDTYELLIIDNGSIDRTHEIVRNLGFNFEIIPKVKVGALRNHGVAIAQGQYVAFIDADVEISPLWIQNALASFQDPNVVASGCFPMVPPSPTWVQRVWDLHQRERLSSVKGSIVKWLPSMNLIVRRDDFIAIGGFNEQLETAEDVDLCYRLGKRGAILSNPTMQAVHWGEARDLKTFWRKEVWRGLGNLRGVLSHGFRWDEVPSLGYPLYIIFFVALFCLSLFFDIGNQQIFLSPLSFFLLILPAVLLSLKSTILTKCIRAMPKMFILYFLYGLARATSILKTFVIPFQSRT